MDILDVAFAAVARRDISPGVGGVEVVVTFLPGTSSSVLSSCARTTALVSAAENHHSSQVLSILMERLPVEGESRAACA